jgi:hypothetical protein
MATLRPQPVSPAFLQVQVTVPGSGELRVLSHNRAGASSASLRQALQALVYNSSFHEATRTMEAERVNAIAKRLHDVEKRAADLRRYL